LNFRSQRVLGDVLQIAPRDTEALVAYQESIAPEPDSRGLCASSDAEAMLQKMKISLGDAPAYQYAEIYAQWGNIDKAPDASRTTVPGHRNRAQVSDLTTGGAMRRIAWALDRL
jgi:hypothetical protein